MKFGILYSKVLKRYAVLFDLLFNVIEEFGIEELAQRNVKTIADFLKRYDARILALGVQHTVDCGRRNARAVCKHVHGDPLFMA